eukprot:EG_transcript_1738
MTSDAQCLPFLPTILSLSITIFMGVIAFVIHLSSGQQRPAKVARPKGRHRAVQTDDLDARAKKESTSMAKQLKQQKIVSCNLEEENEALQEQVTSLKRAVAERKAEAAALREQLENATARGDQLAAALKKAQVAETEEKAEKKSDAEFQNAMAMLLDLAEQSVNREIRHVSGGAPKGPRPALALNPDDFAPEDWTFMMSVAGLSEDRRKDLEGKEQSPTKLISRQEFEVPVPQLLFNEPSPTTDAAKVFPESPTHLAADHHGASTSVKARPSLDAGRAPPIDVPTSEENLSPDPADVKASSSPSGRKPLPLDGGALEDLSTAQSWASLSSTPSFSEEPVFNPNPNAKPFVPKRQQMQQEIQKRLQQWKDFYYTQVQPQEAAAVAAQQQQQQQQQQQLANGWAEGTPPRYSQQAEALARTQSGGWGYCPPQYYPPQLEWDQAQEEAYYDPYTPQPAAWDRSPQTSEVVLEELWPSTASAPSEAGDLTSHQPYSMHCKCTSCQSEKDTAAPSAPAPTSAVAEARCAESGTVYDCLGDEFDNPTIGLAFRFPLLAKEGQEPCGLWRLAHEAFEPFYLARFTPLSGLACQIVITEEYLQPPHTLSSYVDLSKLQTERQLAAYRLVFQSERQVNVGEFEAFEVIYKQGDKGDMLVWSLCILAFERVLTLQVVAASASKYNVVAALGPVLESLQVAFPQPLAEAFERQQTQACETVQRAVRCWMARRAVRAIRHSQHAEEVEENDVFIRVTTRINPKFTH